tara:strand:+ start:1333 stop:1455 length:123 start_codon:yes stop_codon:yes gene_type:complete
MGGRRREGTQSPESLSECEREREREREYRRREKLYDTLVP